MALPHDRLAGALFCLLAASAPAAAQELPDEPTQEIVDEELPMVVDEPEPTAPLQINREGDYHGVAPGKARPDARKVKKPSRPTVMWIGFQPLEGGASRVFLQLSTAPSYLQGVAGKALVVSLADFRLETRNDMRPLDARFFDRAVARVFAKPARLGKGRKGRRSGVEVHVEFKEGMTPKEADAHVEQGPDGFHYLYLDFGPGG